MRRFRPTHYSLAFLTVAVAMAAVPAAVSADDGTEPAVPADDATRPPQPAAPTPAPPAEDEQTPAPPTTPAPQPPETTEPPAEREPSTPTAEAPAPADTTPTTPEPGSTPPPVDGTSAPQPTTPPTTTDPAPSPVDRPTEPTPRADDELDTDAPDALPDAHVVRPIAFPVLGAVRYGNDWGNCRDGCARRHVGTDMLGVRMQPLLAAVDGTVTRIRHDNAGIAGNGISITGADGWYYNYFHVNNDTPGTDDGVAGQEWQILPELTVGSTVRAGQVIGYMGDSGNAEGSVPHLHFEIRQPDRTPVNPYHSLAAAQQRETCQPSGGVTLTDPVDLSPAAVAVIPIDGGGRWLIDPEGHLYAEGPAARTAPAAGVSCAGTPAPDPTPMPVVRPTTIEAPAPEPLVAPAAPAPSLPVPPSPMTWTVERGESLWRIAQEAYGVSDTAATVSLVNLVFDENRDVVTDPNVIEIGMTLQLPPRS